MVPGTICLPTFVLKIGPDLSRSRTKLNAMSPPSIMLTYRSSHSTALRAAVVSLLLATAAIAQSPTRSAAIDAFRDRLKADVAADNIGSIAAAVVIGDSIVWAEGFGWADRDKHIPAGPNTIYRLGSVSKSFTAFVLVQLVDRMVIALDDPVERFFP